MMVKHPRFLPNETVLVRCDNNQERVHIVNMVSLFPHDKSLEVR